MRSPMLAWLRAGVVLPVLALTACNPPPPATEKPRPVRTVTVTPLPGGEDVVQTGEIRPHVETDVGFRLDGRLTNRSVELGSVVRQGEVLATLDDTNARNDEAAAQANLASAGASEDLAKVALDRQQSLLDRQVVAQARVDEARANWRAAVARREAAEAALANAASKLGYTRLIAPKDGIVTAIGAQPGQVVPTGQMVVRLAGSDARDAVFNVSEALINSSPRDIEVKVALLSDPTVTVIGTVRDVAPSADPVTRTYRVRIALPAEPPMAFGAAVTGTVRYSGGRTIALPASALTSQDGQPAVLLLDRTTATLTSRSVVVARYTPNEVIVASGLAGGEEVITAGVSKLRPGQAVAVEGAQP